MVNRREMFSFARRDVDLVGIFMLLLVSGFFFPVMLVVALAFALLVGASIGVRELRRRRRWRTHPPGEFWAERFHEE